MKLLEDCLEELKNFEKRIKEEKDILLNLIKRVNSLPDVDKLAVYIIDMLNRADDGHYLFKRSIVGGLALQVKDYAWVIEIIDNRTDMAIQELSGNSIWDKEGYSFPYKLASDLLKEFSFDQALKAASIVLRQSKNNNDRLVSASIKGDF